MFILKIFQNHPTIVSIVILSILFFAFYPSNYTTIDEHSYISNAMWIKEGILEQPCDKILPGQYKVDNYCVYKYNIGFSLFLIPFIIIEDSSVFLVNYLFFVGAIFLFSLILKKFKLKDYFIYLFAFFPSFVFYSRTGLSEISSLFFTLLFTYCLLSLNSKSKKVYLYSLTAGLVLGISLFIKYTNIVHFTAIFGILFYKEIFNVKLKTSLLFLAGFIPLLVLLLMLNTSLYNGAFNSGYYYADEQIFSLSYFINHFFPYLIALTIFYPLSLPFGLYKNKLAYLTVPLFLSIIAYSSSKNNLFEGRVLDLIFGIRFILPAIPFLFLPYFLKLQEYMKLKAAKIFMALSITALILAAICLSFVHWRYLNEEHKDPWINVSNYIEEKGL